MDATYEPRPLVIEFTVDERTFRLTAGVAMERGSIIDPASQVTTGRIALPVLTFEQHAPDTLGVFRWVTVPHFDDNLMAEVMIRIACAPERTLRRLEDGTDVRLIQLGKIACPEWPVDPA